MSPVILSAVPWAVAEQTQSTPTHLCAPPNTVRPGVDGSPASASALAGEEGEQKGGRRYERLCELQIRRIKACAMKEIGCMKHTVCVCVCPKLV